MFKLTILNMAEFLQTVNQCMGAVYIIHPGGGREDINKQLGRQQDLQQQYAAGNGYLKLTLDVPTASDYMRIISFTVGDC